ncbi:MAG: hypothetical protein ABIO72_03720 [Patescibacteria group bacterium]
MSFHVPSPMRRLAKALFLAGILLTVFVRVAAPVAVHAQSPEENQVVIPGGGFPIAITGNVYEEVKKKFSGFFGTLTIAGITALMNTFQVFTQRIAYDTAQFILSGGQGQNPLFHTETFGPYLKSIAEDAGNQFISTINSDFTSQYGLNLCQPQDPFSLQLSLGLGGVGSADQLKATCTAAQIGAAYANVYGGLSSGDVSKYIGAQFSPSANQLNIGLAAGNELIAVKAAAVEAAAEDRKETGGLKNVQDVISGKIKTPAQAVQESFKQANFTGIYLNNSRTTYGALVGNAFKMGFTQLAAVTASTFVGTLVNGLITKVFEGFDDPIAGTISGYDLTSPEAAGNSNVARAQLLFADLLTPNLITTDQQDFVTELSGCPTPRSQWNCAMDDAFAAALRSVGETGAYTVGQASQASLKGKPPTNPAFLHKDWELVPDSDVEVNTDPSCYQRAYCASNLAKLRYARIVPVGWEMAANSPNNHKSNGKYVTLGEVIQGFNVCNDQGKQDSSHPWCKLIDPNWVLSAPPFQCRVKGGGNSVLSGTAIRLEECSDTVSCLGRDDKGKCIEGYGYCVAEKPVWRFAADSCSERFASCRTYRSHSGEQVSFLRNTLDYGSCSADNIGCLWYSTQRDPVGSGQGWVGDAATGSRIYLDGTAIPCSSGADGCTKLLQTEARVSALNLVENGSFEATVTPTTKDLVGWTLSSPVNSVQSDDDSVDAGYSLRLLSGATAQGTPIAVEPVRDFSFSLAVRARDEAVAASITASIALRKEDGSPVASGTFFRGTSCTVNTASTVGVDESIPANDPTAWRTYVCSFVSNSDASEVQLTLTGSNILIDAVQLEEGQKATSFITGDNSALAVTYMKVPPEEYQCKGAKDDVAACSNYARVCSPIDQGCQGYRDLANTTAPEIPASLSSLDFCPSACVGYAEYRKQPSAFDLGKNADPRLDDPLDDTSANFIPTQAQQCTLADVGCEEFTNVEQASEGGETKAFYNYVRACEKPGDDTETYFTWEGSDTTGYQLRTWSFIHDASITPNPPKIIQKAGPDGILKDSGACTASTWQSGIDADCRQFFNANGDVFYSYFSQTILSSTSCTDFRKNNSDAADCAKTGGTFTPTSGECIYKVLPSESRVCRNVNAGCRAYIGTTGRNTTVVYEESFHTGTSTHGFTQGQLSNESILVGDQSLKVTGSGTLFTSTQFPSFPGQLYHISFWAKTTDVTQPIAQIGVNGNVVATFALQPDWRRYEFGPFTPDNATGTSNVTFANLPNATFIDEIRVERLQDVSYVVKNSWTVPAVCDQTPEGIPQPQAMLGCRSYQDRKGAKVNVRQFAQLCREEAIGCKGFVDTRNSDSAYSQSFTLNGTNTNNKVTPEAQAQEAKYVGSTTVVRPADRYVYLIDEPSMHCDQNSMSCRAFGKPKYAQDQLSLQAPSTSAFESVYFIDDINSYVDGNGQPNVLCRKNELFCDEFKSGNTVAYFRNPADHTCEWKDKVLLKASSTLGIPFDGEYNGWFRKGTSTPCYPGQLSSGNTFLDQNSGDPSYGGWVANCPVEQSECTEFRDPNDHSDPTHPTGKPYYFIKNAHLDLKSCGGKVDLLSGCVLFRDLSDARNRYSTVATYAKSKAEDDTPQSPVDCVTDPANPYCQNAGICVGVAVDSTCQHVKFLPSDPAPNVWVCANGASYSDYLQTDAIAAHDGIACNTDAQCGDPSVSVHGTCEVNNANAVMKVKLDRDCAQWLGCSSSETVYDPSQGKYIQQCADVALCDQSKGSSAGSFCAHYVDRKKDAVMTPGTFFNRETYTKRPVGFGLMDYSGYSIPDRFQAADIQNRKVGAELFTGTPAIANRFALDYRLVAAVPESTGLAEFNVTDNLYPNLKLCRSLQTGRIGYTLSAKPGEHVCYFALDALTERSSELENLSINQKVDPHNVQALSEIFGQVKDPKNDITLQSAFPPAECKAYPENDAPFPNTYVKDWDFNVNPFKAKTIVDGYGSVNLCEFGEDCACSYRKIKYDQTTKYISPFGKAPPAGLCTGGSRDGEACVPGQQSTGNGPGDLGTNVSGEDPGCPGGGRCIDVSSVTLVRGQFGQCLQRDYSRSIAGDPGQHPCLIWNPNPILSGTYDTSHYSPTAGYNPPVNAGEYYCLSYAVPPIDTVWTAESHTYYDNSSWPSSKSAANLKTTNGGNPFLLLPGKLSKFNYDRGYIAGKCPATADICGDFNEGDCNCWDGGDEEGDAANPGTNRDVVEVGIQNPPLLESWIPTFGDDAAVDQPENPDFTHYFFDETRLQNLGSSIDGNSPEGASDQGQWCAQIAAWKEQGDIQPGEAPAVGVGAAEKAPDADLNLGRWIQTGTGLGRTYAEYFIPIRPVGVATWLNNNKPITGYVGDDLKALLQESLLERQFAEFRFYTSNDPYLAACRIPKYYVDGVNVDNFGDPNEVFSASKQTFTAFNQDFDGAMNRSKEFIITDDQGKPMKEDCSGLNEQVSDDAQHVLGEPTYGDDGPNDAPPGQCYMKAWEISYHMDGTPKFEWLKAESGRSFYQRHDEVYFHERTCSKSGFAIRAVFENTAKDQNQIPVDEVTESQLSGPFQLVGFWVTACTVGTDKGAFLYLGMRVKHADICTQLAQTVSPYSRESAAFTDRVWDKGNFVVPLLGFNYASTYGPFGSALVNGVPGKEPLFQTGGPTTNYSLLRPPVFLGSGQSYFNFQESPAQRWGHLSNLFARVYRVYKYYDDQITNQSWVCVRSNNSSGIICPADPDPGNPSSNAHQAWLSDVQKLCGGSGSCKTDALTQEVKANVHRCNGLSGVNAGLTCGGSAGIASLDPVCHNAAMRNVGNGVYVPQLTSCQPRAGWTQCGNGQWQQGNGTCYNTKSAHEKFNAFGCAGNAVVAGAGCTAPSTASNDCPLQVSAQCQPDDIGPNAGHCTGGYEHARCDTNADCVFTASQWWGAYDDGKTDPGGVDWSSQNVVNVPYDTYEQSSLYRGMNILAARAYPADATTGMLPADENGVLNGTGFALPFAKAGNNGNMSDIRRARYMIACNADSCSGTDGYTFVHGLVSPFAAFVRWGAVTEINTSNSLMKRWPSPQAVSVRPRIAGAAVPGTAFVIPGLCEGAFGAKQDPTGYLEEQGYNTNATLNDALIALAKQMIFGNTFEGAYGHDGNETHSLQAGLCKGGINDGALCLTTDAKNICNQGAVVSPQCSRVATTNVNGSHVPSGFCAYNDGIVRDAFTNDPEKDNNRCTRTSGYYPIAGLCGQGTDSEKCLLGYSLGSGDAQASLNQAKSIVPTDVTSGFHSPVFLGLQAGDADQYRYIAHYAPAPPSVAAPDLSRVCNSPGSCPISSVGTFALESQSAGAITYAGGKAQVDMRFYGWAAQEQAPLTDVYVDWGDGTIVKVEDARMKNKKPFCGGENECELVPGLTCSTNADCPAGAGQCMPKGTCGQNPGISCTRDSQCNLSGHSGDTCHFRELFGNSEEACEANYFQFTHAFTCEKSLLPNCNQSQPSNGAGADFRCANRPDITCNALAASDLKCGGDACVAGLAPPSQEGVTGGCFDSQLNVCKFTPRVLLKDAFNWCTGECRSGPKAGNTPTDSLGTKVKHVYGGCWDGRETYKNTNVGIPVMDGDSNECNLVGLKDGVGNAVYPSYRPWIVYQGAIEIGTLK